MAVGRISVKTGSKGKASPHINYILREDKYKPHAKKVEELGKTNHGNMPSWAEKNPKLFWQEADTHERKNGSTYREHILTLPRELNEEQRIELVEEWIKNEIGDKHPYSYAIHNPIALDGKEQPHCHLMFCERELDGIERSPDQFFKRYNAKNPEKGGAKKANTGLDYSIRRQQLKEQRSRWETTVNLHLERAGSKERVNLKNWKEKGLTEKPVNISMIEMSKLKKSQQDLKKAQFEVYKALQTTPTVELNKQNRLAKEAQQKQKAELIKAQHEKMANMSKGEVLPSTYEKIKQFPADKLDKFKAGHDQRAERIAEKAEHELLTPQELEDYSFSKKVQTSLDRLQQEKAEAERLEQERKEQTPTVAPKTTPATANKLEQPAPKPTTLPPPQPPSREQIQAQRNDQLKQAWQTIKDFEKLVSDKAEILKKATVESRTQKAELAQNALDEHDKNKPVLQRWKLDDWKTKKTELENAKKSADLALAQATGDTEKLKGKNIEPIDYTAHAIERLDKDPATKAQHDKSNQAKAQAERILYEMADEKAQEHGADFHAKQGVTYSGKIVRADEKGVLQQTQQGIVYYPYKLDVREGRGYNINLTDNDRYKVWEQMEIRQPSKDPSQNINTDKGRT